MTDPDTAAIDAIVGPDRKRRGIEAAAPRWVLWGEFSRRDQALRYAEQTWPDAAILVSRGQVWRRKGPARRGDIGSFTGRDARTIRIESVNRNERMVHVGGGRYIDYSSYLAVRYELVEWHPDFIPGDDDPQPPGAALPPPEEQRSSDDEEEPFNPRDLFALIQSERAMDAYIKARQAGAPPGHGAHWLPMNRPYWRSRATNCPDCYLTSIDAVGFLTDPANLADYRAGWADFQDTFKREGAHWEYFNELSWGGFTTDLQVAAYLGQWLFNAIRGDVVREHGGRAGDYHTGFMWAGYMADEFLAVCPLADPRVELPADHPLMQCEGQDTIL